MKWFRTHLQFSLLAMGSVFLFAGAAAAATYPVNFEPMPGFPEVTNSSVAAVLGDGRFIIYDGNNVFVETSKNSDEFARKGQGYIGDPAFITVSPDGHTCLLGAGEVDWTGDPLNDWLWLFDANAPANSSGVGIMRVTSNYWGIFLDEYHVLLDCGPGWISELAMVDLRNPSSYRKVVIKGQSSASLVQGGWLNEGYVYATIGYGTGAGTTRRFAIGDLMAVFEAADYDPATSPLRWDQGQYVGVYDGFSSGPSAVTDAGSLVFGSNNSEVLFTDPFTGAALGTAPVSSVPYCSVRPYYNPVTKRILAIQADWSAWPPLVSGYITDASVKDLPAADTGALACTLAILGLLGWVCITRRMNHDRC